MTKPKGKKSVPGQMTLPWAFWEPTNEEISEIAQKFVLANGYPTSGLFPAGAPARPRRQAGVPDIRIGAQEVS